MSKHPDQNEQNQKVDPNKSVDPRLTHLKEGEDAAKSAADEAGILEHQKKAAQATQSREAEQAQLRKQGQVEGLSADEERVGTTGTPAGLPPQ